MHLRDRLPVDARARLGVDVRVLHLLGIMPRLRNPCSVRRCTRPRCSSNHIASLGAMWRHERIIAVQLIEAMAAGTLNGDARARHRTTQRLLERSALREQRAFEVD